MTARATGNSLPPHYRQREVSAIMRVLRAGDSCSIVGVSGTAKSNLFRFLLKPEVREHYLGGSWRDYIFLPGDSHELSELSERALYALLLTHLVDEAKASGVAEEVVAELQTLSVHAPDLHDSLAWQPAFKTAVHAVMAEPRRRLVFLFDQFDQVYQALPPRFFANLRSLRDSFKYRVSYIALTRDELRRLCHAPECEEFYELLQSHVMGLGPYDQRDAWTELERVASRYDAVPQPSEGERLIRLTGGHPGLLKAAYLYTLQEDGALADSDAEAAAMLLASQDVKTECVKLWRSLQEDEREGLHQVVQQIGQGRDTDVSRRLQLKGMVVDGSRVFSPVFARYVKESLAPEPPAILVQAGPIAIDAAGEVWIGNRQVEETLSASELRLLTYLCTKAGQLCSKDEIIVAVHPDKFEKGETMRDDALSAMVERLRKRIEPDPSHPRFILTVRGKGYMLKTS